MKKRIVAFLLASFMAIPLAGCSGNVNSNDPNFQSGPIEIEKSMYGNPIAGFGEGNELTYGGDPSVLVDGDTIYLYTGHDTAPGEAYVIPEYICYSSTDMVNWVYEGSVLSMKDVSWADRNSAWAGQVAKHYDEAAGKDMYYFYFCSWANTDGGRQSIGVAVSDSPTGPFVDIGAPMINGSFTTDQTSTWNDIDPTVWIETDENGEEHRYLCWGNSKLYMCELNEDMTTVKDCNGDGEVTFGTDIVSQKIPTSFTEAAWLYRRQDDEGNYYGDYYLFYAYGWREQLAYATTDDLMRGGWMFGDNLMRPSATSNTNHPAVFDFKGETYIIYHNGSLPKGSGFRRVACVENLEFYSDGAVKYLEETATGISGIISALTSANGDALAHAWFNNAATDDMYPYKNIALGSGLDKIKAEDTYWEIVPGKADEANANYVSIESYNKAGLYITASSESAVVLCQDFDGKMADAQTFITVGGLNGEGVSFESVEYPGMYLTLSDGSASLTDGSDKSACSFNIATVSAE